MTYPENAQTGPGDAMPLRVPSRWSADFVVVSSLRSTASVRAPQRPIGPSANVPRPPPGGDGLLLDFAQGPIGRYGARMWWVRKAALDLPTAIATHCHEATGLLREGPSPAWMRVSSLQGGIYGVSWTGLPGRLTPWTFEAPRRWRRTTKKPRTRRGFFSTSKQPISRSANQPISSADHGSACTSCRCRTGTDRCGRPSAHRG
ncbi:hypothetical protein BCL79_3154 [Stenotrophomonas rhizophila]|uniref:Uncharacterized protein n=1 Tax=Stenotrophomonas rhizophila TaxID=216778 RepID=A0A498CF53_9GAMM|nr:hypothetical protein BCL79_3154 [Stenotrophomonas rhizophila]